MEETLQTIRHEVIQHGNITLKTLYPKQWKKLKKALSLDLSAGSVEIFMPVGLPSNFKENLFNLVQAVCHQHNIFTNHCK